MPNHLHAIFYMTGAHGMHPGEGGNESSRAWNEKGGRVGRAHISAPLRRQSGTVGSMIAGFKSTVTKRINEIRQSPGVSVWQRNYYEHVIRNDADHKRIAEYIKNNPSQWAEDTLHPDAIPS